MHLILTLLFLPFRLVWGILAFGRTEWSADAVSRARWDIASGLAQVPRWFRLSLHDIGLRYRRTRLGPFWITLSIAMSFTGMGLVFSAIFKNDINQYLPYAAAGMVAWGLIAGLINDSSGVFVHATSLITSMNLPLTGHMFRMIFNNILIFLHNIVAYVVVVVVLQRPVSLDALWLLPALALVVVAIAPVGLVIAMVGARFRDLAPINSSIVQLAFFVTPVFWERNAIATEQVWVDWNPFYQLLTLVRSPMMSKPLEPFTWIYVGVLAGINMILAYLIFRFLRHRIYYWL